MRMTAILFIICLSLSEKAQADESKQSLYAGSFQAVVIAMRSSINKDETVRMLNAIIKRYPEYRDAKMLLQDISSMTK